MEYGYRMPVEVERCVNAESDITKSWRDDRLIFSFEQKGHNCTLAQSTPVLTHHNCRRKRFSSVNSILLFFIFSHPRVAIKKSRDGHTPSSYRW